MGIVRVRIMQILRKWTTWIAHMSPIHAFLNKISSWILITWFWALTFRTNMKILGIWLSRIPEFQLCSSMYYLWLVVGSMDAVISWVLNSYIIYPILDWIYNYCMLQMEQKMLWENTKWNFSWLYFCEWIYKMNEIKKNYCMSYILISLFNSQILDLLLLYCMKIMNYRNFNFELIHCSYMIQRSEWTGNYFLCFSKKISRAVCLLFWAC